MALTANTVWEVQTTGDDNNGGGFDFDALGDDYTQGVDQATFEWAAAGGDFTNDLASTQLSGWNELTSVARPFVAADEGNLIRIASGTNFIPGLYEIGSVGLGVATLDRPCGDTGDASAGSGILGGALATPGGFGAVILAHGVSGMKGFLKNGTYDIDNASDNVSGGALNFTDTNASYSITGYNTTREVGNNDGNRPTIQLVGVDPVAMVDMNNLGDDDTQLCENIILDANGRTCTGSVMARGAVAIMAQTVFRRVKCDGQVHATLDAFGSCHAIECDARDLNRGYSSATCVSCYAKGCTGTGYIQSSATVKCVADTCDVGYSNVTNTTVGHFGSVAYNCTNDGFEGDPADGVLCVDCVSVENGGVGYDKTSGAMMLINCASGDNTGGRGDPTIDIGAIELTPDSGSSKFNYFAGAASGDFRPDTGGDASGLLAAATFVQSSSENATVDVGAVHHEETGGGAASILGGGQFNGGFA